MSDEARDRAVAEAGQLLDHAEWIIKEWRRRAEAITAALRQIVERIEAETGVDDPQVCISEVHEIALRALGSPETPSTPSGT